MRKKLKELTQKDNFLFGAVMSDPENCKALLERITDIPIEKVDVINEKSIVYHPEYKGIRWTFTPGMKTIPVITWKCRWRRNLPWQAGQVLPQSDGHPKGSCQYIFLNAAGTDPESVPDHLASFLKYAHADLTESETDFHDDFVEQLQQTVRRIKESREWRTLYGI